MLRSTRYWHWQSLSLTDCRVTQLGSKDFFSATSRLPDQRLIFVKSLEKVMNPLLIVSGSTRLLLIAKTGARRAVETYQIGSPACPATNTQSLPCFDRTWRRGFWVISGVQQRYRGYDAPDTENYPLYKYLRAEHCTPTPDKQ
jgi:hypothetical protein